MRYLLVGSYGVGNAGDEILREYFLERFPDCEWSVCSVCPAAGELSHLPAGMRSLFSLRWIRTVRALRKSHGMVFGGGSLFTDVESVRACIIWCIHAFFAMMFRKPVILAFQGIGPFRTTLGRWCAQFVVRRAAFISVRDSSSFARVSVWKKNTQVIQSFDPSILLLENKKDVSRTKNLITYIPRFSTGKCPEYFTGSLHNLPVRVVCLQPENTREYAYCQKIADMLNTPLVSVSSLRSDFLKNSSLVLTERYHGALAALAAGIPFVTLPKGKGDKLDVIAQMCGCPSLFPDTFSNEALEHAFFLDLTATRDHCLTLAEQGEEKLRGLLGRSGDPCVQST